VVAFIFQKPYEKCYKTSFTEYLTTALMPEAGIEPARITIGFTDRRPSIGHLRPRYSPLKNQRASNFTLLAEAARSAQIPLFTCLLEFRERENRSRKVIDAD
jgi:hypothetical protein